MKRSPYCDEMLADPMSCNMLCLPFCLSPLPRCVLSLAEGDAGIPLKPEDFTVLYSLHLDSSSVRADFFHSCKKLLLTKAKSYLCAFTIGEYKHEYLEGR